MHSWVLLPITGRIVTSRNWDRSKTSVFKWFLLFCISFLHTFIGKLLVFIPKTIFIISSSPIISVLSLTSSGVFVFTKKRYYWPKKHDYALLHNYDWKFLYQNQRIWKNVTWIVTITQHCRKSSILKIGRHFRFGIIINKFWPMQISFL